MSDKDKDIPEVDNGTSNPEERGRLVAQLAAFTTRLEILTQIVDKLNGRLHKLEDGQRELRNQLLDQISETYLQMIEVYNQKHEVYMRIFDIDKQIFDNDKRMDDLNTEKINQSISWKEESRQYWDKVRKENRAERWRLMGMIITLGVLVVAVAKCVPG